MERLTRELQEAAAANAPDRLLNAAAATGTVADIPDSNLLERAVRSARPRRGRGPQPRWVVVAEAFALGSTYSRQLVRRFGLDPDEQVKR